MGPESVVSRVGAIGGGNTGPGRYGAGVSVPRRTTAGARLARLGFADPARAERLLAEVPGLAGGGPDTGVADGGPDTALADGGPDTGVVDAFALAADPDLALTALTRIPDDGGMMAALRHDPGLRTRLIAVLGASAALGDHLARHPGHWQVLRDGEALRPAEPGEVRADLLAAVGARPGDAEPVAGTANPQKDPVEALRVAYRRWLLPLAARDLTGEAALGQVAAELADLAAAALEAALAIARAALPAGATPCRLAVIAMGKCGARELNYASDVDVIFVAEPCDAVAADAEAAALRTATQLAAGLIRVCSQSTPEGSLFPVDPNLRPEGRNGPLVRTLASHRAYYDRWAQTWEFQALLKARPVAGDAALGRAYVQAMAPLVWQAAQRDNFVSDVQAMRRRVIGTLPRRWPAGSSSWAPAGCGISSSPSSFSSSCTAGPTSRCGSRPRCPRWPRSPPAGTSAGPTPLTWPPPTGSCARSSTCCNCGTCGARTRCPTTRPRCAGWAGPCCSPKPARRRGATGRRARPDPAQELLARWRQHAAQVQRLHEKLFYRPLLDAVARLPGDAVRLTPQAAGARLEALGYADPAGALRHIEALTSGVSRRAAIQRTLLPLMLGWFADAPAPDAGLLAFHQVSDALGNTPWYLRLLRDDMTVAQRMARLLASSRYAVDLLLRQPETVAILGDDAQLTPRDRAALQAEAAALVGRHAQPEDAVAAVRGLRRRELLRTAMADLLGRSGAGQTGEALTTVAAVTVEAALQVAARSVADRRGEVPTRICVVAMGRFGGHECGYGSDADVMFVHDPLPGAGEQEATEAAHAVAETLRALLGGPAPDPPLLIDPGLRPEGRQGPLVRTLASYRAYYQRWSVAWEAQALLRAEPAAGDAGLGTRFTALANEFRYPDGGIGEASVREIRRIKARMEAERMPRGVDPALHLKLGPGGLSDVEWVVQLLQLRHAYAVPAMRTTRTLAGLAAAVDAGLAGEEDAAALAGSWRLAARIRDAVMLVRGRASDVIPVRAAEVAAVASVLGYPPGAGQDLVQDYRQAARRARAVMERLFYG